jgi:hypothetical protein
MVLQEKYCSVLLSANTSQRTDPGTLPPAGRPVAQSKTSSSSSPSPSRRALIAAKPNHRLKQLQAAVELRVPGAAAQTDLSSTTRSQFSVPPPPEKRCKYDFTMSLDSSSLGGLGRSVRGLDSTADWQSSKSLAIDAKNATFRSSSLVDTRSRSLSERKGLEKWESTTRTSYGAGCTEAVRTASPERKRQQGKSTLQLA